jgi:hypothetical protein
MHGDGIGRDQERGRRPPRVQRQTGFRQLDHMVVAVRERMCDAVDGGGFGKRSGAVERRGRIGRHECGSALPSVSDERARRRRAHVRQEIERRSYAGDAVREHDRRQWTMHVYGGNTRERLRRLKRRVLRRALGVDQVEDAVEPRRMHELRERDRDRSAVLPLRLRHQGHTHERLGGRELRRCRPRRRQLDIGRRPKCQSVGEFLQPDRRLARLKRARRVTGTDHAMRRRRRKPRSKPRHPSLARRLPTFACDLAGEERAPIREAPTLSQRLAPHLGPDRFRRCGPRDDGLAMRADPSDRRRALAHGRQRLGHHRHMARHAVREIGAEPRKQPERFVVPGVVGDHRACLQFTKAPSIVIHAAGKLTGRSKARVHAASRTP